MRQLGRNSLLDCRSLVCVTAAVVVWSLWCLVVPPQWFLELPYLGIPGIVRFIDVRTQWIDDSVKAALRDGIKQVCSCDVCMLHVQFL